MKHKAWKAITVGGCAGLMLSLAACSASHNNLDPGVQSLDEIPSLDAGTDAVPTDGLEADQGSGAPTAPTDTSAQAPTDQQQAATQDPTQVAPTQVAEDTNPADATTDQQPPASDTASDMAESTTPAPDAGYSGATQDYTVQAGDTLMKIAFETYGDLYQWKKVYDMNKAKITNPNALPAGLVLTLEQPSTPVSIDRNGDKYLIKPGDTLGTISDDVYGTTQKWRKLWDNNKQLIKDPNRIFAGFYLYYTMTPEERDQAQKLKQQKELAPKPLAEEQQQPPAQAAQATAPQPSDMNTSMTAQPVPDTRAPAAVDNTAVDNTATAPAQGTGQGG